MKKIIQLLTISGFLFSSCSKEAILPAPTPPVEERTPCTEQKVNPSGRTYSNDQVVEYECTSKHCGILPLSTKNYWIYEDSVFSNDKFLKVQYDTLRYSTTYQTVTDSLVWWQSNLDLGIPNIVYSNDSAMFSMSTRVFMPTMKDVKKDYGLFNGDSIKYRTSFADVQATGRSLKISSSFEVPAGIFTDYLFFEKLANNYRRDQVYFKPGIGVIRYVKEIPSANTGQLSVQKILTLIKYHIE